VITKEGGGYKGGRDRNRKGVRNRNGKGVRNRNRKGTHVGSSEAKGTKCDGNKWEQAGGGGNKAETNWRQTGSKLELAEKQMNSDITPPLSLFVLNGQSTSIHGDSWKFFFCFITIMSNSGKSKLNEAHICAEQAVWAFQEVQEEEAHIQEEWRQEEQRQVAAQCKAEVEAKAAAKAKAKATAEAKAKVADLARRIQEDSALLP
jgi:hypothetical protein